MMARTSWHRLLVAALIGALSACNGRNAVDTETLPAGGNAAGASSRPVSGGAGGGGAANVADAGMAGAVESAGGAPGIPCETNADCPALSPASVCAMEACNDGHCALVNLRKGTLIAHHSPPDCHSDVCDGQGSVSTAYDPTELPKADNPCLTGACTDDAPRTLPRPAATPCVSSDGGTLCDGAGQCVQCLLSKDCPSGQGCVSYRCSTLESCSDKQKNGSETDVDCGGTECAACPDGAQCSADQDCASDTCKPLAKTCSPATCIDQTQDADETDLDCGGACRGCISGQKCLADGDCLSNECDAAMHICGGSTCNDKVEDKDESDVDCGGPDCGGCQLGQKCNNSFDCTAGTCQANVIPHICN